MSPARSTAKTPKNTKKSSAASQGASKNGRPKVLKVSTSRGKNLVIVESPAKARTIAPLLGSRYDVKASIGHIRDLPKSTLGVNLEQDFEPKYVIPRDKRAVVTELKNAAKVARMVYLATDPDREGEAISWHLVHAAEIRDVPVQRVVFHEITPEAIHEAFEHPRDIDEHLVDAQQARRVLDRLVGYSLSPILWRKVRGHLSAGRVQSVALRIVVEREREIQNFVPQEYWSIEAELAKEQTGTRRRRDDTFRVELISKAGQRGRLRILNQTAADDLVTDLRPAAYRVNDIAAKKSARQPEPPFITSSLQQEAARKLRFTAQRTMQIAQQLFEGLDIGQGERVGIITYMRTDSVQVAESAVAQARQYIQRAYGGDFLPSAPRRFTRRARGAQEAHEAIRPTAIAREPQQVRSFLTNDQFRLYDLIWKRMVASQMAAASIETVNVNVEARNAASGNTYGLRTSSSRVLFPGFQTLYQEGADDDQEQENRQRLPELTQGEVLQLRELYPHQHFTQPPPRFTEATLIRSLETNGIGRPSTYAAILATLQGRGYVGREGRQLVPEELGFVVNDLLTEHFPSVLDVQFTAQMEEELDDIADGKREWVPVVRDFYTPFKVSLDLADANIPKVALTPEPTGEQCEKCGRPMVFRVGRFGKFQACSGFPECRNAKPILNLVGVPCPKDGGELVEKRGRQRRRVFYGCANFPACDFTSWDRPIPEPCPNCGAMMVMSREGRAKCTQCGQITSLATLRKSAAHKSSEPVAVGA